MTLPTVSLGLVPPPPPSRRDPIREQRRLNDRLEDVEGENLKLI